MLAAGFCFGNAHAEDDAVGASDAAIKLAQESIIMDGHIDVPYRVNIKWADVSRKTEKGDFDYPRAKAGGLNGPFMSIYVPAILAETIASTSTAHKLIDYVEAIVGRAPDKFAIATSPDDIEAHFAKGLISLPMGMENGSPIRGDLANLKDFYDRGIRYITLTHSKSNHISDSSYDDNKQWGGLSPFGKELVLEMNKMGIMVDISHVSDDAFYDAVKISKAPMIASHSSLRHFTPGFERNMSDDMVKALAKNGGVIMINFGSTFLTAEARKWSDTRSELRKPIEEKYGSDSQEYKDFNKQYREENPLPFAVLKHAIEHIDYAVKLVGVDHVALGSDYDGVGDSLPVGLKDVSTFPNLIQGLLDLEYSEADIKKILGGNTLRVWRDVEEVAASY
ncbi:MAG: dipeptidase [Pseudomonadota bacterium]